jgi:DNA repair protein RadD
MPVPKLRNYQAKGIELIREKYKQGHRKVMFWCPTGGGKTVCFSKVFEDLKPGVKALMIVRGKTLVDQASRRLDQYGIPHGVIMAGHWRKYPMEPIQVCSVDTLGSWLKAGRDLPEAQLLVIDECHLAQGKRFMDVLEHYEHARILSVTATPYVEKGLKHVADCIVKPITFNELVAQGSLVPPKYYAPSKVDRSKLKVSAGEYTEKSVEEALDGSSIYGDIVSNYKKYIAPKPAIVFAVSVKHSKKIEEEFAAQGIKAMHIDANTKGNIRKEAIEAVENGELKILVNVGVFCTGLDIPILGGVIMARPTKSYNLYIQQAGRGTRPYKNKEDFYLLDHVGNIVEHGFIEDEPQVLLDGWKADSKPKSITKTCQECFAVYDVHPCPECGWQPTPGEMARELKEMDAELKEITAQNKEMRIRKTKKRLEQTRLQKGYKKGWMYHQLVREFNIDDVAHHVPDYIKRHYEQSQ